MPPKSPPDTDADYTGLISLEECILWSISSGEMYGLEIVRAIKEVTAGKRQVSVGALYPALHRLEQRDSLTSRMGDPATESSGGARRKYFRITENGLRQLARARRMREQLFQWQSQPEDKGVLASSLVAPLQQELAFLLDRVIDVEARLQRLLSIASSS